MAGWPPEKNAAFTWFFFIRDADGDLVTGATSLDAEVSIDGGAFTDVTPGTEQDETEGLYSIALAPGEMNGDVISLICKTATAGAKTAAQVIYTSTRQIDDLAFPATSGRSIQVETDGMVHSDLKEWLGAAPLALTSQQVQTSVAAMQTDVLTAAALNSDAVDEIVDQVWDELKAGHVGVGSFGEEVQAHALSSEVAGVQSDTDDIQTRLPAALVGGRMDSDIGAITGTGVIVAATFDTGAITATVLDTTAVDEIVDAVWDEVLSGATHNITDSSGKRLRQLQENLGYELGAVWVDTINGTAGTVNFENGTVVNPSLTLADARIIADSLGLKMFRFTPGSSITLAQSFQKFEFIGQSYTVDLGVQDIADSAFFGCAISGVGTGVGTQIIEKCDVGNITVPAGTHFHECGLGGTITVGSAGEFLIERSHSAIGGAATPSLDFGVAIANSNVSIRAYSGGIELLNMGQAGTDDASIEGMGQIIVNANSIGGTIEIRGLFDLTDSGAATITQTARYSTGQVNAEVLDVMTVDTFAQPTAPLAATASLKDILVWLGTLNRNKFTQTTSTLTIRDDGDAATIATAPVSDAAGTATRGEFVP